MDVVGVKWTEWKVLLIVGSSSKIRQNLWKKVWTVWKWFLLVLGIGTLFSTGQKYFAKKGNL
jgi:hypothetical protein